MNLTDIIGFFQNTDSFTRAVLLVGLIVYNFYALMLAFQIFSYNRLMNLATFAPVFQSVAVLHALISFILLLIVVFSL
jgi:hypothetical protein